MVDLDFSKETGNLADMLRESCDRANDSTEKTYYDRYCRIHDKLSPYQDIVEKSAYAQAVEKWHNEYEARLKGVTSDEEIRSIHQQQWDTCPLFYLNNHGSEHIKAVQERTKEILVHSSNLNLNSYELFILLCAIEVHDIGNIYGRIGHEGEIGKIIREIDNDLLDSVERTTITRIAMTHGGKINDDKDTINHLLKERTLFRHNVRERLLAAILRFADELADDNSRAGKIELELGAVSQSSIIFHRYSESLHTVQIVNRSTVKLCYEFTSEIAVQKFKLGTGEKYLLDEIYDRTLKMERERRYCMRYMRPYISIEDISVEIIIQDTKNPFKAETITYTLNETGYPAEPVGESIVMYLGPNRSGEEIALQFS